MVVRLALMLFFYMGCTRGTCLKEDITWLSTDIMDVVEPVSTPYLCQGLCGDMESCSAFTWTTENNTQLKWSCFLFGSISNRTSCKECVSGPPSCTCSLEGACYGDEDNILDIIPAVQVEGECQDMCSETPSCMFYTWHDATSFPSYTCILLTSCDVTDSSCSGCYSGPPACSSQLLSTTSAPDTVGKARQVTIVSL